MHKLSVILSFVFAIYVLEGANTTTQSITFSIEPIAEIGVSGDPPALVAQSAQPGSNPSDVENMSTFYAVTTNGSSEKVSVSLDSPMPTGTNLFLKLDAPQGATCLGDVCLDTTCQSAVCGISQVAQSNLQICYLFQASISAGKLPPTTRIVTFTLAP